MRQDNEVCHCTTALVQAPAKRAFAFLSDAVGLGGWALSCMNTEPTDRPGIYTGRSMFDGSQTWFSIDAYPELLLVDYRLGTPEKLEPRISARVVPGETGGLPHGHCYVTLTAWRERGMRQERWSRLCAAHEAEIWLIKSQIEARDE